MNEWAIVYVGACVFGWALVERRFGSLPVTQSHPGLLWEVPRKQSRRLSTGAAASPLIVYGVAMLVAD